MMPTRGTAVVALLAILPAALAANANPMAPPATTRPATGSDMFSGYSAGGRVAVAKGAPQTWSWTAPSGSHVAFGRIDYEATARGGERMRDVRISCTLRSDGDGTVTDTGTGSDEAGSMTLVTPLRSALEQRVSITCTNSSAAAGFDVTRVAVHLLSTGPQRSMPVYSAPSPVRRP